MSNFKKCIQIDLDGVLNEYSGKFDEDYIPKLKEGAYEFLENLSKISSMMYIDDRAICFKGNYAETLKEVENLRLIGKNNALNVLGD